MKEIPTVERMESQDAPPPDDNTSNAIDSTAVPSVTPPDIPQPNPLAESTHITQPEPDLATHSNGHHSHPSAAQPGATRPLTPEQPAMTDAASAQAATAPAIATPPPVDSPKQPVSPAMPVGSPRRTRPLAPRPPARKRRLRTWDAFTRREKIIFVVALVAFLVGSPIFAASLLLHNANSPHAPTSNTLPNIKDVATVLPKVLDPERREAIFINQMVSRMTLAQELGQMIIVEFTGSEFNDDLQYMLVNQQVGGTILYAGNVETIAQTQALDAASQAHAQIPLFISTDQEGGLVNRLLPITGWRPSAEQIGATNDPNQAYQQGVSDATILSQLGINLNLAPVADVQTVSDDATIIPTRMYGSTPDKVTSFVGAYLNGLQGLNVIGCLKHWPGLGWSTVDPHDALPVTNRSQADLNNIDFAPYRALIAQGDVDMIMSTHTLVTAYDSTMPASLSPILIDQVLRHDLGYQGVVITDGLYMGAITARWSVAQAAVLAVIAGNDLLLGPWNHYETQKVLDALNQAVSSGQITKARIDESVKRILALKIKYGLIKVPTNVEP
jgi:beta-N-acetylhexosaminidase